MPSPIPKRTDPPAEAAVPLTAATLPLKHRQMSYRAPAIIGLAGVDGAGAPILLDIHIDTRPEKLERWVSRALEARHGGRVKALSGIFQLTARRPPDPEPGPVPA
jgi:hypothetical protein